MSKFVPMHTPANAAASSRLEGADWWRGAVGYEIYVRSFADGNGDGIGDLIGVADRLPYLAELGIDVVWLTPFMPSPGFDHGYDVSDYCDVDPVHGTLADWDHLADTAERLGVRLFVDIVPNHTSSAHRWFTSAVADPTGPMRDYYVWADPAPDGGPPNNWVSHFGGPAWTRDPGGSGQYYCHLFLPEQPDLNWANPAVMNEFASILRFWCDRGASGFRIDVAHALTKDPDLRDNPVRRETRAGMHPMEVFASFDHVHDLNRIETARMFRTWRAAVADHGAVLVGEMDTRDVDRFAEFVADGTALHAGFVLQIGLGPWRPSSTIDTILEHQARANGGCAWEVSNHDQARAVSRYGGGEIGLRRTLALTTLMTALDGMVFIYQGEELGLPDAVVDGVEDPMSSRNGPGMWSRDVARGPVPWTDGPHNGFTTGSDVWLRTRPLPTALTVAHQVATPGSTWHHYRELVGLRTRHPDLWHAPFEVLRRDGDLLVIGRGNLLIVANLGAHAVEVPELARTRRIFVSTTTSMTDDPGVDVSVGPETTIIAHR
ncbi:MAG: alpha-amylase family glycosyl hydrolase [Ilumatobacteraceae bacterium]